MTAPLSIKTDIAPGELIDKITILQIKTERLNAPAQLENVRRELAALMRARDAAVTPPEKAAEKLDALTARLKAVNEALWDIEDDIRAHEREKNFGEGFIKLARAVYHQNDKRAEIKREINALLGADFSEEKSYTAY